MNSKQLKDRLTSAIMDKAEAIIEAKAKTFAALLQYEIAVANTELAMSSSKHGYNFRFISEEYAKAITIGQTVREDGRITMTLMIPKHAFKNASDGEVEFFKTYILANAMKKLQYAT